MKRLITFILTVVVSVSTMLFMGCTTQDPPDNTPPVNYEVVVEEDEINLEKGDTVDVANNLSVTNLQNATFTLTSSSNAVQISGTQITALSAGSATITVTAETPNGTKSATFSVVVTVQNFTVTFKNGQDVISTVTVEKGLMVEPYSQEVIKLSDVQYDYDFDCWTLDGEEYDFSTPITGNIELEASFTSIVRKYTVTFKNDNGEVISSSQVDYGSLVTLPSAPTKDPSVQYVYEFANWTGYTESMTVSGNLTFVASYTSSVRKYNVTFLDEYGLVLYTLSVDYNSTASAPNQEIEKDSDVQYDYTFDGWKLNGEQYDFSTPITADIQLEPSFVSTEPKVQKLKFNNKSPF